jgi:hypothetical protein
MELGKYETNDLFEAITARGLDPHDFNWESRGTKVATLSHIPSKAQVIFTLFDGNKVEFHLYCYIGMESQQVPTTKWSNALKAIKRWLDKVRDYNATPDLWGDYFRTYKSIAIPADDGDNSPFTPDEQRAIAADLRRFSTDAKQTFALTEEQAAALEAKLEYLIEAAKRSGRTDWKNMVVGTFFAFAAEHALAADVAKKLFGVILGSISHWHGIHSGFLPM